MQINFKNRQSIKAFFKEGKPALILKLNLPVALGEGEFASRFNSFYDALTEAYINKCESYLKGLENVERPISFTVDAEQNVAPVPKIFFTRTHKLRYPSGEIRRFEYSDIFDESGLLLKENKRGARRAVRRKKRKE